MILPPCQYRGDRREIQSYFSEVLEATELPCMLDNNPVAYWTDVQPDQIKELAQSHSSLRAVKESTGDAGRITELVTRSGERLEIAIGVDDSVLEAMAAGAGGWVAGLANALPAESAALWESARRGDRARSWEICRWFLSHLGLETDPKFVQLIKLVQTAVGRGRRRLRPPRLELAEEEISRWLPIVQNVLAGRSVLRIPS